MSSDGTQFEIFTLDPAHAGTHTFTLRAFVVNPDAAATEIEDLSFTFTVEILPPDCSKAVLTCPEM